MEGGGGGGGGGGEERAPKYRGVGTGGGGGRGGLGPPNLIGGGADVYFSPPNVTPLV